MSDVNFNQFFPYERIIYIEEQSPGYEDHASDVWRVKTEKREVIVRASGIPNVQSASAFFKSLNILFGIDPCNVFSLETVNNTLIDFYAFTFPRVLEKHQADMEYAIVELLKGTTLGSFMDLPSNELKKFGRNLAQIHSHKMNYWGNPTGTFQINLENVNSHIVQSMRRIVNEFYSENCKIAGYLPQMERVICNLPAPEYTSYVLVDMDPSQFLTDNGAITGLVDTEAYVIAPRELDFIALEFVLDRQAAQTVSEGYETVLALPDLRLVRIAYRYLYRLVEIQGDYEIEEWLAQPVLFE